jgi:hypothetical protein
MSAKRRKAVNQVGAAARRARGVAMLIAQHRYADIAEACGVSKRQVERWAALPEVRAKLAAIVHEAERTAGQVLIDASRDAAEVLTAIMRDPLAPRSERARCALAVLDRTGFPASQKNENTNQGPRGGPHEHVVTLTVEQVLAGARDGSIPGEDDDEEDGE